MNGIICSNVLEMVTIANSVALYKINIMTVKYSEFKDAVVGVG